MLRWVRRGEMAVSEEGSSSSSSSGIWVPSISQQACYDAWPPCQWQWCQHNTNPYLSHINCEPRSLIARDPCDTSRLLLPWRRPTLAVGDKQQPHHITNRCPVCLYQVTELQTARWLPRSEDLVLIYTACHLYFTCTYHLHTTTVLTQSLLVLALLLGWLYTLVSDTQRYPSESTIRLCSNRQLLIWVHIYIYTF